MTFRPRCDMRLIDELIENDGVLASGRQVNELGILRLALDVKAAVSAHASANAQTELEQELARALDRAEKSEKEAERALSELKRSAFHLSSTGEGDIGTVGPYGVAEASLQCVERLREGKVELRHLQQIHPGEQRYRLLVGRRFHDYGSDEHYVCVAYKPDQGLWMERLSNPRRRTCVNERAIGRVFHNETEGVEGNVGLTPRQ